MPIHSLAGMYHLICWGSTSRVHRGYALSDETHWLLRICFACDMPHAGTKSMYCVQCYRVFCPQCFERCEFTVVDRASPSVVITPAVDARRAPPTESRQHPIAAPTSYELLFGSTALARSAWSQRQLVLPSGDSSLPLATSGRDDTGTTDNECKICMNAACDAIFHPCQHRETCLACAAHMKDCPICRRPIGAVLDINKWKK